jgi:hypothetical protein
MGRKASVYSMSLVRGSTWREAFVYKDEAGLPFDLTNFTARMQIRKLAGRTGLTTNETLVMELLSTGGSPKIFLTPGTGQIDLLVSAADTVALSPLNIPVRHVYELELVDNNTSPATVIPFLTGRIRVRPEINRA